MPVQKSRLPRLFAAVVSAIAIAVAGLAAPANALPSQGSATGTLYISEMSSNTIWVGDISNPTGAKSVFWTEADAQPDQVATTLTAIAWSSLYAEAGQPLYHKLKIAPIARTAANVVTVNLTGNVKSLAADSTNNRILAVVDDKIISVKPDGTDLRTIVTDADLATSETANEWALAIDEIHHKIYAAAEDIDGSLLKEYSMDNAHLVEQSRTVVYSGIYAIDGLGVDPITQTLYWTRYEGDAIGRGTTDGLDTTTILVDGGNAPTGAVVSNSTGKLYFTTEGTVEEINLDGTDNRVLYTGQYNGSGYEGLAIAFGVTIEAAPEFDVTYNANVPAGKTSTGALPTGGTYTSGDSVDVADNTEDLAVSGYAFAGWNTKADGTGNAYPRWDGETYIDSFTISSDTTLYAQWAKLTVTKSGQKFNVTLAGMQPGSYKYLDVRGGGEFGQKWIDLDGTTGSTSMTIGDALNELEGSDLTFKCDVEYTFSYVNWTTMLGERDENLWKTSFTMTIPCGSEPEAGVAKKVEKRVFFDPMSPKVHKYAKAALKALVAKIPAGATNVRIKIVGFVQGATFTNNDVSLSTSRAKNVAKELKKLGLKGTYNVSGSGRAKETGKFARRVVITVTYVTPVR